MTDYYNRPELSNSTLSKFKNQLNGRDYIDPAKAFEFGSVVDALLTEQGRINWLTGTLDGQPITIDKKSALKMVSVFQSHPIGSEILKQCEMQKVSITEKELTHNGYNWMQKMRCKWDFFGPINGDLKTTNAKTKDQFVKQCHMLGYFRARAFYMDIEDTNTDILIAISKINFKLFTVVINRNDDLYKLGKQQYQELAFKYHMIHG